MRSVYQAFQEALVLDLLKDPSPKAPKRFYATKSALLPNIRLTRPIVIHQRILGKRAICVFYCWSRVTKKGNTNAITKVANIPKTRLICSHCSINLCIECFTAFHYFVQ